MVSLTPLRPGPRRGSRGRLWRTAAALAVVMPGTARADLDVVFAIDTTGSMSGELREAKERVGQLASALRKSRPEELVRFGVVAFRDRKDTYRTRKSALTSEVEETQSFLSSLSASGGGDAPEDVLAALEVAIHEMQWSAQAEKRVFLVGDAPPHLDYGDGPRPGDLMAEARARRIVVDAIGCRSLSGAGRRFFRDFAYGTEGRYQHIGHVDRGTGGLTQSMLDSLEQPQSPGPLGKAHQTRRVLEHAGRSPFFELAWVKPGCTFDLKLPAGVHLGEAPQIRVAAGSNAAIVVSVVLESEGHSGGIFELAPCLEAPAPLSLRMGGSR